jgi:hypothetical protein
MAVAIAGSAMAAEPAPWRPSKSQVSDTRQSGTRAGVAEREAASSESPKLAWRPRRPGKLAPQDRAPQGTAPQNTSSRGDAELVQATEPADPFEQPPARRPVPAAQVDPFDQSAPGAQQPAWTVPQVADRLQEPVQPDPSRFPEPDFDSLPEERPRDIRQEAIDACRESIADLRAHRIANISLDISIPGEAGADYPYECELDAPPYVQRHWAELTFLWRASALCHKPLYFEDVQLERHGHSWGPLAQPFVSSAHFFATVPVLPYKMGLKSPHECVYTLGHYRPGSCAPYMIEPVPISVRAALFQAGAVVGAAAAIP